MLEELAEPITTTASQRRGDLQSADWRLVVAKQRSLRPGSHSAGEALAGGVEHVRPVAVAEGGLGQQRHRLVDGGRDGVDVGRRSTRWMASGATAMVPTASSWPSWPT